MSNCELNIDERGFIKSKINGNSHTIETALNELIHNSITSNADDIYILHNNYCNPIIIDNGCGMDKITIEKLKKFYDCSKRVSGQIGTYNIGLKDALLKLGGKWIILSKMENSEDSVYCDFNSDNLEDFANGNEYIDCIDSGFCNRKRENLFINILDELGLINKKKETSFKKFSGTVIYQQICMETNSSEINEEYKIMFDLLYNNLQLKLYEYNINFIHGLYTINKDNNSININDNNLTTLVKFDWLLWDKRNKNKSIEFDIAVYKPTKNILFSIEYNNNIYKYITKNCEFNILKSIDILGKINVKCNIISEGEYNKQELYYKNLNYKSNINGIILCRNGLNLYDFPNKWDNRYMRDNNKRKYLRIFVSFQGSDVLDKLFNILPNKSLFLIDNINKKLQNILNLIKSIIDEYLDLHLDNKISLNKAFINVLQNIDLEDINNKLNTIKNNWNTVYEKYKIYKNIEEIKTYKKYKICKVIYNYFNTLNKSNIYKVFTCYKINYLEYKSNIQELNSIIWIQKRYKLVQKYKILRKIYSSYMIYKFHNNFDEYLKFKYFTILNNIKQKNITNSTNIYTLVKNVRYTIRCNQLKLLKHKIICNKLEQALLI